MRLGGGQAQGRREGGAVGRRETEKKEKESLSHPHIKRMVEAMGEGRQSGLVRMGAVVGSEATAVGAGARSKDMVVNVKGM